MQHKHTNTLIHETSPYLLQHAHNPVHWYPWGKEALDKAKAEDKVILVSIGYSACHWCHVMERESFENEDTAAIMNQHFINIKIDREERPDIDHIYMDAVQAMTGSGGWPLNVFLTPDTKPFYGGTYFPPVKAFNRASWREVLHSIAHSWNERRNEIEAQAENLTDYIGKSSNFSSINRNIVNDTKETGIEKCGIIFSNIMKQADTIWGGFGKAPKFPQTFTIQYLLDYYHYTENEQALKQALLSIDKMLDGGIYDHVGGGLARYSTDEEWLAPHFEKMLYDNALLIIVLCDAFLLTQSEKYKKAILKTVSFIQNEMTHSNGGFYAALDADSEGEEGKFYVWSKKEVDHILENDSGLFCEFFNVTEKGNWEHQNILRILKPVYEFSVEKNLDANIFLKYLDNCLDKLYTVRAKRVRPSLDDKVILGWNALMIKALAKAAVTLQDNNCKAMATGAYNFLLKSFNGEQPGEFLHTWKNGQAKYPGFLDDYAYLADACLAVYETTFDIACLNQALQICQYVVDNFSDEEEILFFYAHKKQGDVIVRKKEIYDGATPSANAIMAANLHRLSVIFDISGWRTRSETMIQNMAGAVEKYPSSFGVWAAFFMQIIYGTKEIAVVGKGAFAAAAALQSGYFLPGKILMAAETDVDNFPMLVNKNVAGPAQLYLCRNYICHSPVQEPAELYNKSRILNTK